MAKKQAKQMKSLAGSCLSNVDDGRDDLGSALLAIVFGFVIGFVIQSEFQGIQRNSLPEDVAVQRADMAHGKMGVDMSGFTEESED